MVKYLHRLFALGRAIILGSITGFIFIACNQTHPLDALPAGETGRVVRIINGGGLILDTGLKVRLVGLEAPRPAYSDQAAQPYADISKRELENRVLGRRVQIFYPGLTRDKYDRALAHIRLLDGPPDHAWVNLDMIKAGHARARLYPDTSRLGEVLLIAEREARQSKQGLWQWPVYAVQNAASLKADIRGFYLLQGKSSAPLALKASPYSCEWQFQEAEIDIKILESAGDICGWLKEDMDVILRGYLNNGQVVINHPAHIERVAPAPITASKAAAASGAPL